MATGRVGVGFATSILVPTSKNQPYPGLHRRFGFAGNPNLRPCWVSDPCGGLPFIFFKRKTLK